jgi:hypothetical protein
MKYIKILLSEKYELGLKGYQFAVSDEPHARSENDFKNRL